MLLPDTRKLSRIQEGKVVCVCVCVCVSVRERERSVENPGLHALVLLGLLEKLVFGGGG